MKARVRVTMMVGLASIVSFVASAAPQETRADVIRQQQADRQQQLEPPQPTTFEKVVARLERLGLFAGAPVGVYPWIGSVYPGGGYAAGGGYRKPFGDDGALNMFGGYSIATYTRAEANLALPTFVGNRARITMSGQYIDAPDVQYFGRGNTSRRDDRTRFGYSPSSAGARLDVDVSKQLKLGGGVAYRHVETSASLTGPSIEERFSPANTPGLELSRFTYIDSTARAVFDYRRPLGYSGKGGMYRAQFDDYRERDNSLYSFKAIEAEALQLIPVLRANWVIALRGLATVTDIDDSSQVPYFLLPSIGGGTTVRGYQDFRFQDRNRLVMNAELRWTPARFLDMALFYDAGKVEARHEDLDFDHLESSYGIGMRLIGLNGYAVRIEAAHSQEHNVRLIFSVGGAF